MAWDKTKPAGTTKVNLADDQIRDNFAAAEDALARDHNFPGTMSSDAGEHTRVKFYAPIAKPSSAANKAYIYGKDDAVLSKIELFWLDEDGNEAQLTKAGAVQAFPTGTIMLFGQNSAPTGWTRKADWQDNAMLCYAASGDIAGSGAVDPQSAHTHTGPSHTHTGPSHTHTGPSHTHTTADLTLSAVQSGQPTFNINVKASAVHNEMDGGGVSGGYILTAGYGDGAVSSYTVAAAAAASAHNHGATGAGGTGATGADGTGATGAGGTGATGANTAPYYQEVIAATKD